MPPQVVSVTLWRDGSLDPEPSCDYRLVFDQDVALAGGIWTDGFQVADAEAGTWITATGGTQDGPRTITLTVPSVSSSLWRWIVQGGYVATPVLLPEYGYVPWLAAGLLRTVLYCWYNGIDGYNTRFDGGMAQGDGGVAIGEGLQLRVGGVWADLSDLGGGGASPIDGRTWSWSCPEVALADRWRLPVSYPGWAGSAILAVEGALAAPP